MANLVGRQTSEATTVTARLSPSRSTSAGAVDAISQSIVLGANVQLNNLTFTGHDSVVADHGSTAHHDGPAAG